MGTIGKTKKTPTISRAEKAFAAILVVSVISMAAVLITLFFVISNLYSGDVALSESFVDTIKKCISAIFNSALAS